MRIRKYRGYQAEIHEFIVSALARGSAGTESPTGSGKTTVIVGLAAHYAKPGRPEWVKKVLVATTQEQIEQAIARPEFDKVRIGRRVLPVPEGLIRQAREEGGSVKKSVKAFLASGKGAMACTHSALATMSAGCLPRRLKSCLLVLDEGHHSGAKELAKFLGAWTRRGGRILWVTATAYRGDGRKVGQKGMPWYVRSLAQHMEEGYAPRDLSQRAVAVSTSGRVSFGQLTGDRAPPRAAVREIVKAIAEEWVTLGRPKLIVRVPPLRGGSAMLVARTIRELERAGARAFDATGTGEGRQEKFLRMLREEGRRTFRGSKVDVVVGVQRVVEGTDWPHCETVFSVGMPASVTLITHMTGRALRMKDKTCPRRRAKRAEVVFFVAARHGDALADMSKDHSKAILLVSCFMADSQSGQQWLLEKELKRYRRPVPTPDGRERARIMVVMAEVRERAKRSGKKLTVEELVRKVRAKLPDADPREVNRIIAESLLKGKRGKKVRDSVRDRMRIDTRADVDAVLDALVREFRRETLDGEDSMVILGRQAHALNGGSMRRWSEKVVGALLTEEEILEAADAYASRTGGYPNQRSGETRR